MRTTVTLDPDTEALIKRAMRERGVSFKETVNEAIRAGLTDTGERPAPTWNTYRMGKPRVDITKALELAGHLEDEEIIRKLSQGK
jgi:hypothetical protein